MRGLSRERNDSCPDCCCLSNHRARKCGRQKRGPQMPLKLCDRTAYHDLWCDRHATLQLMCRLFLHINQLNMNAMHYTLPKKLLYTGFCQVSYVYRLLPIGNDSVVARFTWRINPTTHLWMVGDCLSSRLRINHCQPLQSTNNVLTSGNKKHPSISAYCLICLVKECYSIRCHIWGE